MQFILSESYVNKAVKKTKGTKYSKLFFPSHFTIMNILGFTYENSVSMVEKKYNDKLLCISSYPCSVTSFWGLETGHYGDLPGVKIRWLLQQKHAVTHLARALDRPESTRKLVTNS